MPVQVASNLIPKNNARWFVTEDKYIKGGWQIVADQAERDTIPEENRKAGMVVHIQSDRSNWQLSYDLVTWIDLQLGGVKGDKGDTGERGEVGPSLYDLWQLAGNNGTLEQFMLSQKGERGEAGERGELGPAGKSLYQVWIEAGNNGDEEVFFESLRGKSLFEIWKELGNEGDEAEFIESLRGENGDTLIIKATGPLSERDQYDSESIGFTFLDEESANVYILKSTTAPYWSAPIPFSIGVVGAKGDTGERGEAGKNSFELWQDQGNGGTFEDFLDLNRGAKGDVGEKGEKGDTGEKGEKGDKGEEGKSLYRVWLDAGNVGTEAEFFLAQKGEKGDRGNDGVKGDTGERGEQGVKGDTGAIGKSLYQVWLDAGNTGTEAEFFLTQKGAKGDKGEAGSKGDQGVKGDTGEKGADSIVAGPKGDQGLKGDKGDTGEKGDKGDTGERGPQGETNPVIPYDMSFFVPGKMVEANEVVGSFICARTIAVTKGMPGSVAKAAVPPALAVAYVVKVNGVNRGTVNFAANQTSGTFTMADNLTLNVGDIVQLVTPATAEAAIKDVVITIVGRANAPLMSMAFPA